jgi:hypothetical protein
MQPDHKCMGESGFFFTNTENFLLLTQSVSSQFFLFLCQKCIPHPSKKKSSNLHESQELKSVKILKLSPMQMPFLINVKYTTKYTFYVSQFPWQHIKKI